MQLGIGLTSTPTGPVVGPVLVLGGGSSTPSEPTEFTAHYTTADGGNVTVQLSGTTQARADELSKELQDKVGLIPADPNTSADDMPWIAIPLVSAVIMFVIGLAVFAVSFIAHMGDLISFDDLGDVMQFMARWGLLVGWPVITVLLAIMKWADSKATA